MSNVKFKNQIPPEILEDPAFKSAVQKLPSNYNFELAKTIWRARSLNAKRVALQLPEGLLLYSCLLADIVSDMANCDIVILADVTYGACCVDHFTAKALGCDLLVHYGHSCLVPVQETEGINMLYVFVDIKFDTAHLIDTIVENFDKSIKMALFGTIQFVSTLHVVSEELKRLEFHNVIIPQARPLSKGELLGCTAPKMNFGTQKDTPDAIIYIGDGRFHLEAAMIANPKIQAYRYDPYSKKITQEYYDHEKMKNIRWEQINKARNAQTFGLILGSLGRQGNPKIFNWLKQQLEKSGKQFIQVVLSEIFPKKLDMFDSQSYGNIDCWVQVACPRLSIDWGRHFQRPLLTPYETAVLLEQTDWKDEYPMDYYSTDSLGPWTNKNAHNVIPRNDANTMRRRVTIESEIR